MLRHMLFQHRGKTRMHAVLLGYGLAASCQYCRSRQHSSGRRVAGLRPVNSLCSQRLSS